MIYETTAAALEFGFKKDNKGIRNVFIFNLGVRTFDATILQVKGDNYKVLAKHSDAHLGGEDFDSEVVTYCKKMFIE